MWRHNFLNHSDIPRNIKCNFLYICWLLLLFLLQVINRRTYIFLRILCNYLYSRVSFFYIFCVCCLCLLFAQVTNDKNNLLQVCPRFSSNTRTFKFHLIYFRLFSYEIGFWLVMNWGVKAVEMKHSSGCLVLTTI